MIERNRYLIDALYAFWEAGDLVSMMNCFSDDVMFAVHPTETVTFLGQGRGRGLLQERLEKFLSEIRVMDYLVQSVSIRGEWADCRVKYHYRHRQSQLEIDGSMRHIWKVVDDLIVRVDIIHDARRMAAFFELAARAAKVQ